MQVAAVNIGALVAGRVVAVGVGGVSAIVILYVSEVAPRKVRGTLVSIYHGQSQLVCYVLLAQLRESKTSIIVPSIESLSLFNSPGLPSL